MMAQEETQQPAPKPEETNDSSRWPVRRKLALAILVLALVALVVVLAWPHKTVPHQSSPSAVSPKQATATVVINSEGFTPKTIQVSKGTSVTWNNVDTTSHEVAADPYPTKSSLPGLDSGVLSSSKSYQYHFDKSGTYSYHDQLHPLLSGTVIVR